MKGRRSLWIYRIICSYDFPSSFIVKRSLKSWAESKSLGIKKFRRAHSSFRLFCRGVPVSKMR